MRSKAKLSPATRGIADLEARIEKIRAYERWGSPTKVNFEEIVGPELWMQHWGNWSKIHGLMKEAQVVAQRINQTVAEAQRNAL